MNLIDIRLVLTQIIGFLLMVWALRRWAWGPLIAVLEARRAKIAGDFASALRRSASLNSPAIFSRRASSMPSSGPHA